MEIVKVDLNEYKIDEYARPEDEVFEYRRKHPINEELRGNHNVLFLKRSLWTRDAHIREVLGYLIAKRCDISACEAVLSRYPTIRDRYEDAVISYSDCSKYDRILLPISLVNEYRQNVQGKPRQRNDYMLDVESVLNTVFYRMQQKHRSVDEYDQFLQDFIDMMIYDIAFVNADRDNKNWLIRENDKTGAIDLYPLFDNASVFATEYDYENEFISEEKAEELSESHPLLILTPLDYEKGYTETSYKDMFEYLLTKYPRPTAKALEKIDKINEDVLSELIDQIPNVDPERKHQMLRVYAHRKEGMDQIRQKHKALKLTRNED